MKEIPANEALTWFGLFIIVSLILSVIAVILAVKIDRTSKKNHKKKKEVDRLLEMEEEIPEDYYLKY